MDFLSPLSVGDLNVTGNVTGIPGLVNAISLSLDFGSVPVKTKSFQVSVPGLTAAKKIFIQPNPDSDEYEMDVLSASAYCSAADVMTVFVGANPGPITGTRKFIYFII